MKAELIVDAPIMDRKDIWVKRIQKPRFDHPFHFHQFCELVWIERGEGQYVIGDHVGHFGEGDVVLMGANLPHLWRNTDGEEMPPPLSPVKATAVYFPEAFLLTLTDDPLALSATQRLLSQASRGIRFGHEASGPLRAYMQQMDASQGLERLACFLSALAFVERTQDYNLLASEGYRNRTTAYDLDRYTSIYQYLLQNFHRTISLREVAELCHLSPTAFCRYFKSKTQKTFSPFPQRVTHWTRLSPVTG